MEIVVAIVLFGILCTIAFLVTRKKKPPPSNFPNPAGAPIPPPPVSDQKKPVP